MMHNGVYQKPLYEAVFSTSCFWRIAKSVKKTRPEGTLLHLENADTPVLGNSPKKSPHEHPTKI